MKKLIALLLSIILVLTFSGVSVIAATDDSQLDIDQVVAVEKLTVQLESDSASSHDDVTLDLTLNGNSGFSVMILNLDHGSEKIILKSATTNVSGLSVEFSNQKGGSTLAFYNLGSNCTVTGVIATLVFSIGSYSNVNGAEITLSAEEGNVCDANGVAIKPEFINGKIFIDCEHTYIFNDRVEPSCTKEGAINYRCTICGDIKTTSIDKISCTYSATKIIVVQPDCDTDGVEAYVCQFCGSRKEESAISAVGHKYVDETAYIITKEPTCTTPGSKYRICYVCNEHVTEEIPSLGHDEGTWRITNPGDCTSTGVVSRYCNRCDFVIETKVKEQSGHFMGWAVTKKATCKEAGIEQYMCLICGGEKGDSKEIAKLDHVHGKEVVTKEPSCSEKGVIEVYCKDCNEVVATKEIETLSHIKGVLKVVTAPTSQAQGQGEYRCKNCDELLESVTLDKVYSEIYFENMKATIGRRTAVKVYIKENAGFSVGVIRVKYDVKSLVFSDVTAGKVTSDVTYGCPKEGEIAVVVSLSDAEYTENGLLFTINFTLTADATDGKVELFYDAQNDFADKNGERVFVNMKSGEIEIITAIPGDVDGDGDVDATDLANMKLHLVGLLENVSAGTDVDGNQKVDAGDLATLKLMLAGLI